MAKRRYRSQRPETLEDALAPIFGLLSLGIVGYILTHRDQLLFWGFAFLGVCLIVSAVLLVLRKRKRQAGLNWDDDKILYMLKGMSPAKFEQEIAEMFQALGYDADVVGGANDGGIDVVAHKDGKKYYIQCKKFMTRDVTPHGVRDFLGAITNVNNPADQGFFVTSGGFTLMAKEAVKGNPRIELIDGLRLIEYYKMAHGKNTPEEIPADAGPRGSDVPPVTQSPRTCPRCRGELVLRTAKHGERAGKQFWGCSNFAKTNCTFAENVQ
jgi:restriction system protein